MIPWSTSHDSIPRRPVLAIKSTAGSMVQRLIWIAQAERYRLLVVPGAHLLHISWAARVQGWIPIRLIALHVSFSQSSSRSGQSGASRFIRQSSHFCCEKYAARSKVYRLNGLIILGGDVMSLQCTSTRCPYAVVKSGLISQKEKPSNWDLLRGNHHVTRIKKYIFMTRNRLCSGL